MKVSLLAILLVITSGLFAQTDTIGPQVFYWNKLKIVKNGNNESRPVLKGSTSSLDNLSIHVSKLAAGQNNHAPQAYTDYEELVIVKEGNLTITVNGSSKTLGPGGVALIVAGDEQSFQNTAKRPAEYFVIRYKSKKPVNIDRGKQSGGSFIKDWNEILVKKTDKGESRPFFDRPTSMFGKFDVHATALNPGFSSHAPHTHKAEEIILMIKGEIRMQLGEAFHKASAGDVVFVTSNIPHAAENSGKEQCGYFAIQWHNEGD